MNNILGIGVIGLGQISQIAHLPYLNELPEYEIRAICDISDKVLNSMGRRFGVVNCYSDYKELLGQADIDAVLVSTSDHADIAVDALNVGKHVFCKKPMAFNLLQCDAMIEAANNSHVKLMIGYMKRFDPAYQFALPILKDIIGLRFIRVHDLAGREHINRENYDLVARRCTGGYKKKVTACGTRCQVSSHRFKQGGLGGRLRTVAWALLPRFNCAA